MQIPLTADSDYDAARLRVAARGNKESNQTRRLLTLAAIYDGDAHRGRGYGRCHGADLRDES